MTRLYTQVYKSTTSFFIENDYLVFRFELHNRIVNDFLVRCCTLLFLLYTVNDCLSDFCGCKINPEIVYTRFIKCISENLFYNRIYLPEIECTRQQMINNIAIIIRLGSRAFRAE